MEISRETKRRIADGLETLAGGFGFMLGMMGSGNVRSGKRGRRYFERKMEEFYRDYGIPYTPKTYLRKP